MYDNLVKRLRRYVEIERSEHHGADLEAEAADAIEELQKVANTLLAKYEEEATTVVWEYSGNIDKSLDWLHKEVGKYKAQINVVEE